MSRLISSSPLGSLEHVYVLWSRGKKGLRIKPLAQVTARNGFEARTFPSTPKPELTPPFSLPPHH